MSIKNGYRYAYDHKYGVFRAYLNDEMIPVCPECDNRHTCDFKKDDLYGCNSFSKITSGKIKMKVP